MKFGNAMLYAHQQPPGPTVEEPVGEEQEGEGTKGVMPGLLRKETVDAMWAPVADTKMGWDRDGQ